jgi:drug/metabolite transporter (DMT)-like permease
VPLAALALVLVAACTHATWNLYAKRAADSRHFVWLYSVVSVTLWAPVVVVMAGQAPHADAWIAVALVGTAVLHTVYSLLLQRGYQVADLSVIYPVVRGTGPLLAFLGGVVLLRERPSLVATLGAGLVVTGVLTLAGGRRLFAPDADRRALAYGLLTGALVASYTVWDGWSVKSLGVAPVLVDYAGNTLRCLLLAPRAWRERGTLRAEARRYGRNALAVGILGPFGYILVLYAMKLAPVSHVAPARELSMTIAAWLGARVLAEGDARRRIFATVLIVGGVVALAFG